ncbi:hypothetical protein K435DRAFT_861063 [Dendrothele bispora CBS 962.96]|uniref:F-box domain-containing protein n=1 Tax=Dendrothele bispora (strain CBS 962.96) TaxID=1314807 RepID=A0A4S8LWF4_DENBC|nr:hypothetical protein K435DRAFT_861063 [Dendrothele bispora CBS 962.96]
MYCTTIVHADGPSFVLHQLTLFILHPSLSFEIVQHLPLTDATLLSLTQVCSTWRQIITGDPKLWRQFTLSPRKNIYPSQIKFGQQWLQRASPYGLDITIDDSFVRPSPYNLLKVVAPFYRKWRTLQLSLSFDSFKPLFGMNKLELPMLEEVSLNMFFKHGENVLPLGKRLIKTFAAAPLLQCVQVSAEGHSLPLLDYTFFPYQRLTKLVLVNVISTDPVVITQILALATNLESAELDMGDQSALDYEDLEGDEWKTRYDSYRKRRSNATCHKLVDLSLVCRNNFEIDFVLDILRAPALQELKLYNHWRDPRVADVLKDFQERSKAPLRVLHLIRFRNFHLGFRLVPFLKLVGETLQELLYDFLDGERNQTQETIDLLIFPHYIGEFPGTGGEPFDPLLPNLKRLGIALDYSCPEYADVLVDVVASRGYALDMDPECSDPSVLDSMVFPGYRLGNWLKEHRLEEFMVFFDDPQDDPALDDLKEQLEDFTEREVDALQMACCKDWTRAAPYWLAAESLMAGSRVFGFDSVRGDESPLDTTP